MAITRSAISGVVRGAYILMIASLTTHTTAKQLI